LHVIQLSDIIDKIEDVICQKKVLPGEKLPTEKEM